MVKITDKKLAGRRLALGQIFFFFPEIITQRKINGTNSKADKK